MALPPLTSADVGDVARAKINAGFDVGDANAAALNNEVALRAQQIIQVSQRIDAEILARGMGIAGEAQARAAAVAAEAEARAQQIIAVSQRIDQTAQRAEDINTGAGLAIQAVANRAEDINAGLGILIDRDARRLDTLEDGSTDTGARIALIEGAAADLSIASARRSEVAPPQGRPGEAPAFYSAQIEGEPGKLPPLAASLVAVDTDGAVVRLVGAGRVGLITPLRLEAGRLYQARWAVRRRVDPGDPANAAVRLAIRWLDRNKGALGLAQTVVADLITLLASSGRQEVVVAMAASGGASVPGYVTWPTGAVYARVFAETFGDGTTDVEVVQALDVTETGGQSPDLALYEARIQQTESADAPARLDMIERQLGGARINDFLTRDMVAAANVSETVDALRIIKHDLTQTDSAALYVRAAVEPAHPRKVRSLDGAWWELSENQELAPEMVGAAGDGATLDTDALAAISAISEQDVVLRGRYRAGGFGMAPRARLRGQGGLGVVQAGQSWYARTSQIRLVPGGTITPNTGAVLDDLFVIPEGLPDTIPDVAASQAALAAFKNVAVTCTGFMASDFWIEQGTFVGLNGVAKISGDTPDQPSAPFAGRTMAFFGRSDTNGNTFEFDDVADVPRVIGWHEWPLMTATVPGVSPFANDAGTRTIERRGIFLKTTGACDWAQYLLNFSYGKDCSTWTESSNVQHLFHMADNTGSNPFAECAHVVTGPANDVAFVRNTVAAHKVGLRVQTTSDTKLNGYGRGLSAHVMAGLWICIERQFDLITGNFVGEDISALSSSDAVCYIHSTFGDCTISFARAGGVSDGPHINKLVKVEPGYMGRLKIRLPPGPYNPSASGSSGPKYARGWEQALDIPYDILLSGRVTIDGAFPDIFPGVIDQSAGDRRLINGGLRVYNGAAADQNNAEYRLFANPDGSFTIQGLALQGGSAVELIRLKRAGLTPRGGGIRGIPSYASDAAADGDATLLSGDFYRLTGSRALYQKP